MESSTISSARIYGWVLLVWRGVLALCVVGILFWVLNYHFPLNGEKTVRYAFDGPSGIVSFVYPVSRVRDRERAQDGAKNIRMVEDPVYVDVTTRTPFDTVTLEVTYDNTTDIPLSMGIKQKEGNSPSILLKKFESVSRVGNWSKGTVSFDLRSANHYNGKYTLVFSAPGLVTEKGISGEIRLSQMTLHLKRKPLSMGDIISALPRLWQ